MLISPFHLATCLGHLLMAVHLGAGCFDRCVVLAGGWELTACAGNFGAGTRESVLPNGWEPSLMFAFGRSGVASQFWHFPAV